MFNMRLIDDWDKLVLRLNAENLYRMQVKVFDVDRPDFFDKITDALSSILGVIVGKAKGVLSGIPIVGDTLGGVAEDLQSTASKLLAGGDKILFKGSQTCNKEKIVIEGKGSTDGSVHGGYRVVFKKVSKGKAK